MTDHQLFVGRDESTHTELLLTVWDDGAHEVAIRTPEMRTWSPPIALHPEPAEVTC
jgi:hypothetical protein